MTMRARLTLAMVTATAMATLGSSLARAQGLKLCAPGDRRLDQATCLAYRAVLDSAKRLKLPTDAIEDKAVQGVASESDGPMIVAAIQRLLTNLYAAKQSLGRNASDRDLKAAANALDAGATTRDLAVLAAAAVPRTRSLETPLTVLVELAAQVPMVKVIPDVKWMLQVAVSDAKFQSYQRDVQAQIALGGDPTIVANRLSRAFQPIPHH